MITFSSVPQLVNGMEKVLVDVTKVNNVWKMEIMAELIYSFSKTVW